MTFQFFRDVDCRLTERIMVKLTPHSKTAAYLNHSYTYRIQNMEDGRVMLVRKNVSSSKRMNRLQQARAWIAKQEEDRLIPQTT